MNQTNSIDEQSQVERLVAGQRADQRENANVMADDLAGDFCGNDCALPPPLRLHGGAGDVIDQLEHLAAAFCAMDRDGNWVVKPRTQSFDVTDCTWIPQNTIVHAQPTRHAEPLVRVRIGLDDFAGPIEYDARITYVARFYIRSEL